MSFVSSDRHAWLRPLYARLKSAPSFALLAPSHQFNALLEAAKEESPSKAALMREYEPTTQGMLLNWLQDAVNEKPNPSKEVELWRVRKGDRELTCRAVYLSHGIDVRLMEADGFRRTQLLQDAREAEALSKDWREKLARIGWQSLNYERPQEHLSGAPD